MNAYWLLLLVAREKDMTTPAALASTLLQASYELINVNLTDFDFGQTMTGLFKMASLDISLGGGPLKMDAMKALPQLLQKLRDSPTPTALASILDALTQATQSTGGQHPVIVLDECNVLTQWKPTDNVALGSLLAFFVRVARQECTAHVLLVTSESAFVDWIQQGGHACCVISHAITCWLAAGFLVSQKQYCTPSILASPPPRKRTCLSRLGCCTVFQSPSQCHPACLFLES